MSLFYLWVLLLSWMMASIHCDGEPIDYQKSPLCWAYHRSSPCGPRHWHLLMSTETDSGSEFANVLPFSTCLTGSHQSPVDISNANVIVAGSPVDLFLWDVEFHELFFYNERYQDRKLLYFSPVTPEPNCFRDPLTLQSTKLRYVSIKTPSEHTLSGAHYDVELQFVHSSMPFDASVNAFEGAEKMRESFAIRAETILSLFVKVGLHNRHIESLFHNLRQWNASSQAHHVADVCSGLTLLNETSGISRNYTEEHNIQGTIHLPAECLRAKAVRRATTIAPLKLTSLLPARLDYYHYVGSSTMPPCHENVRWFIFGQAIEMSLDQVELLRQHGLGMGDSSASVEVNHRPTQPTLDTFTVHYYQQIRLEGSLFLDQYSFSISSRLDGYDLAATIGLICAFLSFCLSLYPVGRKLIFLLRRRSWEDSVTPMNPSEVSGQTLETREFSSTAPQKKYEIEEEQHKVESEEVQREEEEDATGDEN